MVFLVGPRQCGKTTIARALMAETTSAYYNWDVEQHRRAVRSGDLDPDARLWVFDELHKYRQWRNWLKGQFDLHGGSKGILVTGSARLDVYHRGGDSLQGRFFVHRLHPLTLAEVDGKVGGRPLDTLDGIPEAPTPPSAAAHEALATLYRLGGFPEPFLSGSDRVATRWRRAYGSTLVRQDVRDLETVRDLDKIELLFERLPVCVGSPLSIASLREDLEVAFETARNWVSILERTYAVFRVAPFGPVRIKAVKKEQKLYFWDWARVTEPGARFENLLAVHLLRLCHWADDVLGEDLELRYFRDVVGHEVDFILLRKKKPWLAVEAKSSDRPVGSGLRYLLERARFPHAIQVAMSGTADITSPPINGCRVRSMPAARFLSQLA
ncbi:MAG TPA: AAA family ATPase [Polyangiaceae bacterium]|nr:AAA family ATPase [Polyangiaceae bacterium]